MRYPYVVGHDREPLSGLGNTFDRDLPVVNDTGGQYTAGINEPVIIRPLASRQICQITPWNKTYKYLARDILFGLENVSSPAVL